MTFTFSRRFYPKRLTIAFRLYIFISTCVPWESNPQPFAQLTQCSTTEPHGNDTVTYILVYHKCLSVHNYAIKYNNLLKGIVLRKITYLKKCWFSQTVNGNIDLHRMEKLLWKSMATVKQHSSKNIFFVFNRRKWFGTSESE